MEAEKAEPAKEMRPKQMRPKADTKKEAAAPTEAKKEEKAPEPAAGSEAPTNPNCDRYGMHLRNERGDDCLLQKMGIEMDANTKKANA